MPLRTSPDAPHFCGNANSLSHYLAEVEDLCQSRQRTTGPELIKYAVYYTDEKSWNIWDSAREVLTDPASWEDFKNAMHDLYPSYEVIHAHAPLLASVLPSSVPSAPLPPLLTDAAVMLAPEALQVLLSLSAPSTLLLPPLRLAQSMPPATCHRAQLAVQLCPVSASIAPCPADSVC